MYGVLVAIGLSVLAAYSPVGAAEKKSTEKSNQAVEGKKGQMTYQYVAQPGDAYTQLVRKAVQTYGLMHKKELGEARIVAIETEASKLAGWPQLNAGQIVTFKGADVATWVKQAEALNEEQVAAWSMYVPYVNFDTRQIGE
jgi:hypothetical protein